MRSLSRLSVLFLEDSKKDAEIVYQKLSDDFECPVNMDTVDTESTFLEQIRNNRYDIILADYTLPGYNAPTALAQALTICPDTPFICVSGTIGEDLAVEMLKQGAADYVLKDRLGRLTFAIIRALDLVMEKEEQAKVIAERRLQKEALRQLEESNSHILNSTNDGIAMYNRDGIILNINTAFAKRFGMTSKQVIGTDMKAYMPEEVYGDLYQRRLQLIQKVFDTGEPTVFEDSRGDLLFNNRMYPVTQGGNINAVTLFSTDITDQMKAIEEASRRAEYQARYKVLTDFFINVSHEFKTPLTIILNAIEMTEMRFKNLNFENKESMLNALGIMRQNAYRLLKLIANILDTTKTDAGHMMVTLQELDISSWLEKLVESVDVYSARRGIEVTLINDSNIKTIIMDGEKLDRIMLNLLSNSIKHTGEGGHIHISLSDTTDKIRITVEDDGEGIPDNKKDIIFNRFRQVDTSMARASEGSGIGLSLTKALVELLHGRIWFESKFGEGTKFYVELPVAQNESRSMFPVMDGMTRNRKAEIEFSDII